MPAIYDDVHGQSRALRSPVACPAVNRLRPVRLSGSVHQTPPHGIPFRDSNLVQSFPQYGLFPRWPDEGTGFIHPDDRALVSQLIPSERVFRRDSYDGSYYHYRYGGHRFRLRPCLWLPIQMEGVDVLDQVETIGLGLERDRFVGQVMGMYYVRRKGRILYRLRRGDQVIRRLYPRDQIRLITEKRTVQPGSIEHPAPRCSTPGDLPLLLDSDAADED